MRDNDKMYIIVLLIAVLATMAIMLMIYLFATKIGPSPEDYTILPLTDVMDGNTSRSSVSP